MQVKQALIVIPARYGSTRFPGKPLELIAGKSLIQRVYEQCRQLVDADVLIATDDERILKHCISFNAKVVMTTEHPSGTDRVAEAVANSSSHYQYIINVQGDEPCIYPEQIQGVLTLLKAGAKIATLKKAISVDLATNPNVVKVVCNDLGNALYFSRSPIPFQRDTTQQTLYYKHIGIYGFARETLFALTQLASSSLENTEQLEQLRWLQNGFAITCATTDLESPSVDVPEDILKVEAYLGKV